MGENNKCKISDALYSPAWSPARFRRGGRDGRGWGFVEDSELQFLARTYYFNRDYRDSPNNAGRNRFKPRSERNGYREEATQGLRLQFASGYTPGSLGFGLDAHAMLGLQLDSGGGRTGTGNLPVGADGHPDHRYGKVGGALRLRHGETRLKYGQTTTSAPVFAASSNRTLAGMAYGLLLEDRSFDGLLLEGGRFTAASGPGESKVRGDISTVYGRLGAYPVRLDAVGFLGGQWQATERLQLSLYASRFDDIWQQAYFGASHRQPLGGERALRVDLDAYRSRDSGQSRFGRIDTLASSWPWATNRGRSASPWPTSVSMASSRSTTWPSATGAPARPWYWPTRWATPTSTDRASVPGNYAMTWTSARSACLGSACMRCMPAAVPGPAPAVPPRASTPDSTGVTGGTGKATSASPIGSRRAPRRPRAARLAGLAPGQRELSRRRHRRNPAGRRLLPRSGDAPGARIVFTRAAATG